MITLGSHPTEGSSDFYAKVKEKALPKASTPEVIESIKMDFSDLTAEVINGVSADTVNEENLPEEELDLARAVYMTLRWEISRRKEEEQDKTTVSSKHEHFCTNAAEQDYEKADFIYKELANLSSVSPEEIKEAKADLYSRVYKEIYGINNIALQAELWALFLEDETATFSDIYLNHPSYKRLRELKKDLPKEVDKQKPTYKELERKLLEETTTFKEEYKTLLHQILIALIERGRMDIVKRHIQAYEKSSGLDIAQVEEEIAAHYLELEGSTIEEKAENLRKEAETKTSERFARLDTNENFEEIYRLLPLQGRYQLRVLKAQKTETYEEREALQNRGISSSGRNKFLVPDLKKLHIPPKLNETRYPPYLALNPPEQLIFCALLSPAEQRYYGNILNVLPNNEKAVLELQELLTRYLKKFALKHARKSSRALEK